MTLLRAFLARYRSRPHVNLHGNNNQATNVVVHKTRAKVVGEATTTAVRGTSTRVNAILSLKVLAEAKASLEATDSTSTEGAVVEDMAANHDRTASTLNKLEAHLLRLHSLGYTQYFMGGVGSEEWESV